MQYDLLVLVEGESDVHILKKKIIPAIKTKRKILVKSVGGVGEFKYWRKYLKVLELQGKKFRDFLILLDEKGLSEEILNSVRDVKHIVIRKEIETAVGELC